MKSWIVLFLDVDGVAMAQRIVEATTEVQAVFIGTRQMSELTYASIVNRLDCIRSYRVGSS